MKIFVTLAALFSGATIWGACYKKDYGYMTLMAIAVPIATVAIAINGFGIRNAIFFFLVPEIVGSMIPPIYIKFSKPKGA